MARRVSERLLGALGMAAGGLQAAVAAEFRRLAEPPRDVMLIVFGNGLMMTLAWFLLPRGAHDWLFDLHGPLAFPILLSTWMLADTPATNVLGSNPTQALSVLADRTAYWRWLTARSVMMSVLTGLPSALVTLAIGIGEQPLGVVLSVCVVLLLLPFGIVPIAALLGILLPYRQQPLGWRWRTRRRWHHHLRWIVLVTVPYVLVPMIGSVILAPALAFEHLVSGPGQRPTPLAIEGGAVIATVCATVAGVLGLAGAGHLIRLRVRALTAYLSDPESA